MLSGRHSKRWPTKVLRSWSRSTANERARTIMGVTPFSCPVARSAKTSFAWTPQPSKRAWRRQSSILHRHAGSNGSDLSAHAKAGNGSSCATLANSPKESVLARCRPADSSRDGRSTKEKTHDKRGRYLSRAVSPEGNNLIVGNRHLTEQYLATEGSALKLCPRSFQPFPRSDLSLSRSTSRYSRIC